MEKILKIEQVYDVSLEKEATYWSMYDGFKITTDSQEILCLITNSQNCCEHFGMFESQDNTDSFIGADLIAVNVVDEALNVEKWNKEHEYGLDNGGVMFVNFETNRGTFQLAAYNAHNGYYGHTARLISKQINHELSV